MNKKKVVMAALASIALATSFEPVINPDIQVRAAAINYSNKFYKVRVVKKVAYYKIIRKHKKAILKKVAYLQPGKIVYTRAHSVKWGWTIGKKSRYGLRLSPKNHSWFTTSLSKPQSLFIDNKIARKANSSKSNMLTDTETKYFNDPAVSLSDKISKANSYTSSEKRDNAWKIVKLWLDKAESGSATLAN